MTPKAGQTDLARPTGGFYSLDELKGSTPGQAACALRQPAAADKAIRLAAVPGQGQLQRHLHRHADQAALSDQP